MSIKKKLGLGIASAALGMSLIGGGTFAYFNDVETSKGNSFTAGTIDLQPDAISSAKINVEDIKPGDKFSYSIPLKNAGSLPANLHLDIDNYSYTGTADLGNVLDITEISLGGTDFPLPATGLTLREAANYALMQVGTLTPNQTKSIVIKGEFKDTGKAQNEYQGTSISMDAVFELRQQ